MPRVSAYFLDRSRGTRAHCAEFHPQRFPGPSTDAWPAGESATKSSSLGAGGSGKFEVYGGGGYSRFRPGGALQHINESAWNGGFTDYRWGRLGITGDLRGYYGTAFTYTGPYNIFKPSISQYTFMVGPQYRFVRREHWAIGGQVLVGGAKGNFTANGAGLPGPFVGLWNSGTSVSFAAGVPIDYNIGPALAFRIQPGYWLSTFGSTTQVKNLGFTSGIVYRFGRQ
jgi:hypothetical protein